LDLEVFPNNLGLLAAHLNLPLIVVVVLYLMAAPLLAYAEDIISINPDSFVAIVTDAPIRHSGVTKGSATQVSATQISATQISSSESTITQISLTQVSSSKIYLVETGLIDTGFTQVSATQISSVSKELVHTGSTQVNATQISPTNIHIIQSNANEISFPSSISLQQLFSIHNLPLASNNIYFVYQLDN
jgi:hypothetical protein